MKKTLLLIGLCILLVSLIGCDAPSISNDGQHKVLCQETCSVNNMEIGWVGDDDTHIYCNCEKLFSFEK